MTNKTVTKLRVSCRSGTFRRAGFAFGTEPQDLPLETLSKKTRAAIVNEPMLVAVEVEVAVEETSEVDEKSANRLLPVLTNTDSSKSAAEKTGD